VCTRFVGDTGDTVTSSTFREFTARHKYTLAMNAF
jgi:hypothetical protein